MIKLSTAFSLLVPLLLLGAPAVRAADSPPLQSAAVQPSGAPIGAPIGREELDALFAPVALYSDNLLAQVLMAATYPLEVVQASRFAEQNPNLKGDALDEALAKQPWDLSVKSLVQVPTVLKMMSDKLDWTQKVGDAYLAQPKDVANSIQRLRQRAEGAGNLKTSEHQTVTTQVVHEQEQIIIQQSDPEVMYVPAYNPTYAYGAWPYPSYPPYAWGAGYYPYYPLGGALAWGVGAAVTAGIWNNGWNWNDGNININNNFNNINGRWGNNNWNGGDRVWHHNAGHRRGVNYRDQATRDRFGKGGDRNSIANRQQFRGRDGGVGSNNQRLSNRDLTGGRTNSGAGRGLNNSRSGRSNAGLDRGGRNNSQVGGRGRQNTGGGRQSYGGGRQNNAYGNRSGYDGVGQGGRTRDYSNRGASSRASYGGGGRNYGGRGGGGRSYGGGGGGGRSYGGGGHRGGGGGRGGGGRGGGGRGGGRR